MPSTPKQEIADFLKGIKHRIARDGLDLVPRKKNLEDLAYLGLRIEDAQEVVLQLATADYASGPEPDRNKVFAGEVWTFKKKVGSDLIYIKLKHDEELCRALCLSFHVADGF